VPTNVPTSRLPRLPPARDGGGGSVIVRPGWDHISPRTGNKDRMRAFGASAPLRIPCRNLASTGPRPVAAAARDPDCQVTDVDYAHDETQRTRAPNNQRTRPPAQLREHGQRFGWTSFRDRFMPTAALKKLVEPGWALPGVHLQPRSISKRLFRGPPPPQAPIRSSQLKRPVGLTADLLCRDSLRRNSPLRHSTRSCGLSVPVYYQKTNVQDG